jgi:hypothetical protein
MRVREKMNALYVVGAVVLAGYIGLLANSWWWFAVVLALLVALNVYAGNIRLASNRR